MSWDGNGGFPGGKDPQELWSEFRKRLPSGLSRGLLAGVVGVAVLAWAATGFYIVNPDEVGVVMRFGRYAYTTTAGPHWHLPYPVETVLRPKVTKVQRTEVGFRTITVGPPARYQSVPAEALMLTGDENIVSCEFIVQYRVRDPVAYLFRVSDPDDAVRAAAEAAMREVVGRHTVDDVLTERKDDVQREARDLLQSILTAYNTGVQVDNVKLQDVVPPDQVIEAFLDVASAREDRERLKNEAEAYANDILPKARGQAKKLINEAAAYRETKVKRAQGDAARFDSLWAEYQQAKDVTRKRLYMEAMSDVLTKVRIVLSDGRSGSGVLPVLPLGAFAPEGGQNR